jgi:serine/threonine-protein kinase
MQLLMLMEYVEDRTLADIIQSGPVAVSRAIDYGAQVLSALAYAHSQGVVHRDVKPVNIMITAGGEAKLMDFGIARMALNSQITKTGSTVDSLSYMSPEQIKGGKEIDWRSDLYSLGVTLHETVTSVHPFQGDSGYTIMAAHLESIPKPPIEISPNLPPALSDIILQTL